MSVIYECQAHAECDRCHDWEATQTMRLADFKKYLRSIGWCIGKETLCPRCNGKEDKTESNYV